MVIESQISDLTRVLIVLLAINADRFSRSDELITVDNLFFEVENFLIGINAAIDIYVDSSS